MSKKKLAGIIGVCVVAIVITAVVVTLRPITTRAPAIEAALVTHECTEPATTSLRAQGDVADDGGDWVTRRGFQYARVGSGDLPGIIPLANASFEYGNPPAEWSSSGGSAERTSEKAKIGSYAVKFTGDDNQWGSVMRTNPILPADVCEKTLTLGVWLWSDAPDRVRLYATHWVGESRNDRASAYHPGDGEWHWMTLTVSFPAEVTAWNWRAISTTPGSSISVYADGFCVVWGHELSVVFDDGEFGNGAYWLAITGLQGGAEYRLRAFVQNRAGVGYGAVVTCGTAE